MSDQSKWYIPGPGCLVSLLSFALMAGSCYAIYRLAQPQSLDDIAAYRELKGSDGLDAEIKNGRPRDLLKVLEKAEYLGETIEITENELNRYLHTTLLAKQNGVFNLISRIDGVWVRLENGYAEVVIERRIQGYQSIHAHQISYFLEAAKSDGEGTLKFRSGNKCFGLLDAAGRVGAVDVPQGITQLNFTALQALAAAYEKELELIFGKSRHFEIRQESLVITGGGSGRPAR